MKLSVKYRQWTAALLLALYTFIAAPVQLWHQHTECATRHSFADKPDGSYLTTGGATLPENCNICAHQYSVHYDDQYQVPITVLISKERSSHFPLPQLPAATGVPFSNKGPPTHV